MTPSSATELDEKALEAAYAAFSEAQGEPHMSTISSDDLAHYIAHAAEVGENGTPAITTGTLASLARELISRRESHPIEDGDAYVPRLIRHEEGRFIEFVEHDVATVIGDMMALNVEPVYDLITRKLVGYRIYDDAIFPSNPGTSKVEP